VSFKLILSSRTCANKTKSNLWYIQSHFLCTCFVHLPSVPRFFLLPVPCLTFGQFFQQVQSHGCYGPLVISSPLARTVAQIVCYSYCIHSCSIALPSPARPRRPIFIYSGVLSLKRSLIFNGHHDGRLILTPVTKFNSLCRTQALSIWSMAQSDQICPWGVRAPIQPSPLGELYGGPRHCPSAIYGTITYGLLSWDEPGPVLRRYIIFLSSDYLQSLSGTGPRRLTGKDLRPSSMSFHRRYLASLDSAVEQSY